MTFAGLHRPGDPFVLANAWDAGSAKVLEGLGAKAIATSSAAFAFTLGKCDGALSLEEVLDHTRALVQAVSVPVSIDFEDAFGKTAQDVADNIGKAAATGAAGASIEDWDRTAAYGFDEALDRVTAAAEAAAASGLHLTARADGFMNGVYDMAEAVRRVAAFAEAGADCIYVPALPDAAAMADVVAIGTPVNALAHGQWLTWDLGDFAAQDIARVSLGSTLGRLTQRALVDAATPLLAAGKVTALAHDPVSDQIDRLLGD